jgi:hypothetical protein
MPFGMARSGLSLSALTKYFTPPAGFSFPSTSRMAAKM